MKVIKTGNSKTKTDEGKKSISKIKYMIIEFNEKVNKKKSVVYQNKKNKKKQV